MSRHQKWTTLTTFLGGESVAGGKLKEEGKTHWQNPNTGATNETGFTALPSGFRGISRGFGGAVNTGNWWSLMGLSPSDAYFRIIRSDTSVVYRQNIWKREGLSVRCLKDQ